MLKYLILYRKSCGLQIIHEVWRMLWDYLVECFSAVL